MNGKGSAPRPYSVDMETFDANFDRIFGKSSSSANVQQGKDKSDCKDEEAGTGVQDDSVQDRS